MYKKLLFSIILVCLLGCDEVPIVYKTYKIDNIQQVVYISGCHYELFCIDQDTKELIVKCIRGETTVIVDVPVDEPMYAIVSSNNHSIRKHIEIHIHDVKQLSFGNTGDKYPKKQIPLITPEKG